MTLSRLPSERIGSLDDAAYVRGTARRGRQVDKINPQSAARQASALSSFRRYDAGRQALMRAQLQRLLDAPGLSKDTFEIATRSLKA